jgi:hypothetical protein
MESNNQIGIKNYEPTVVYVRIPTPALGNDYFIFQEDTCRIFCENKELKIEKVFSDTKSGPPREGLQAAVKYCEENKIKYFATYDLEGLIDIPFVEHLAANFHTKEVWDEEEIALRNKSDYYHFLRRLSLNGTEVIPVAEIMNLIEREAEDNLKYYEENMNKESMSAEGKKTHADKRREG